MTSKEKKDPVDEMKEKQSRQRMRQLLFKKNAHQFFEFINFNWEQDQDWAKYQKENAKDGKPENFSQGELEQCRRDFYQKFCNPHFDSSFYLDNEQDRKDFLEFCKFYGNIGSINNTDRRNMTPVEKFCEFLKRLFYLAAFVLLPLRSEKLGPYAGYMTTVFAIFFSALSRMRAYKKNNGFLANFLLEEEAMCFCTLVLMLFCGPILRPILGFSLFVWVTINTCDWGSSLLDSNSNIPGLSAMSPAFDFVRTNIVSLLQFKSYIEVTVTVVSLIGWTVGLNAIFFALVAMQFLRLKYTTSYYTRYVFDKMHESAENLLPDVVYRYSIHYLKNWVAGAMIKKQEEISAAKKARQEKSEHDDNAVEQHIEPQVYEIPPDDLD